MKQLMIAAVALLISTFTFSQQQDGPPKPPPPEKRWEKDSEKIKKAVILTADELSKLKDAFMRFYKEMDTLHDKNKRERPSKEAIDKIAGRRNEAIKKFLSKDKYGQFMKIEKDLGPPKPKNRQESE